MNDMSPCEDLQAGLKASNGGLRPEGRPLPVPANDDFGCWRRDHLQMADLAVAEWNNAVASAVEHVGQMKGLTTQQMDALWHGKVATALRAMERPLHSDVILEARRPSLKNDILEGRIRAFGASVLAEDPEFMPSTQRQWPAFPYFVVEPGSLDSLAREGLILLTNPPGLAEEESDEIGTQICRRTYGRSPMISVELDLSQLEEGSEAAVLLNWSFRGRLGAMAKIFVDGQLDAPAFPVASSDEDRTPNFWTILPWRPGRTYVDLKHVGSGYCWFEHVDVHSVSWNDLANR